MTIEAKIEYRRVRNIRLEYGLAGLKVIVPLLFTGNIKDVLTHHQKWINRRHHQLQKMQGQLESLQVAQRTDQTLRILIRALTEQSAHALGVSPKHVKYRNMKTRWGSCSSEQVITFSTRLKYLPERLIAFVVHHEMVHLQVMRHDQRFWDKMAEQFPDFKQLRKELQLYAMVVEK